MVVNQYSVTHENESEAVLPYRRLVALVLSSWVLLCVSSACQPEEKADAADAQLEKERPKPADLLIFPDQIRAEEASVNAFIERAMKDCASGDYDRFRRLWTTRQDPLSRDEYEQGWQAVQRITIRAVERVALTDQTDEGFSPTELNYAILAEVVLDPTHPAGRREPNREAVMVIAWEQDAWRLARAPKAMRSWIKKQAQKESGQIRSSREKARAP